MDARDETSAIGSYFSDIGSYFEKDIHDRLMIGLLALRELRSRGG
jgi:hypothetical protein